MSRVYLISDDRERAVHGCVAAVFDPAGVPHRKVRINTGDYLICRVTAGDAKPEILACIERKTLPDLAGSINNGRFQEQKERMMKMREDRGCQLYYFIEGPAYPKPTYRPRGTRTPYSTLRATMDSLMIRDGIQIVQTPNELGTAQRLLTFVAAFDRNPVVYRAPPVVGGGGAASAADAVLDLAVPQGLTGLVEKTDKVIATEMWARLAGISISTAEVLTRAFSAAALVTARGVAAAHLAALRTATGRALAKAGRKSLSQLHGGGPRALEVKLLSGVPGVSPVMATGVLGSGSLRAILAAGRVALADVCITQRGRSVRFGEKRADRAWRILHYIDDGSGVAAVAVRPAPVPEPVPEPEPEPAPAAKNAEPVDIEAAVAAANITAADLEAMFM